VIKNDCAYTQRSEPFARKRRKGAKGSAGDLGSPSMAFKANLTSGEDIAILAEKDMQNFVHGDMVLVDTKNNRYRYSEFPGSMKPDLKKLDEFIGIDTTGKTY
jgi:hypothetical protein